MTAVPNAAGLASDTRSIDALRSAAARDPKTAVREAAKQFEALFMNEIIKSMRQATLSSGMLDNSGTQLGTELLDTQFANKMTGLPGGLADAIARQLERQMGGAATPTLGAPTAAASKPSTADITSAKIPTRQAGFVHRHDAAAKAVEAQSGIPAAFMIAQAAHETGWGQREIRNTDGTPSHNLFGIKAGKGWNGPVAEITTTEYVNGQPRKVTAKFRAYESHEASFRDYAKLIQDSPRYQNVYRQATSGSGTAETFAQGLQRAGYATDPAYADKLARVINTTLRLQRATA